MVINNYMIIICINSKSKTFITVPFTSAVCKCFPVDFFTKFMEPDTADVALYQVPLQIPQSVPIQPAMAEDINFLSCQKSVSSEPPPPSQLRELH